MIMLPLHRKLRPFKIVIHGAEQIFYRQTKNYVFAKQSLFFIVKLFKIN